MLVKPSPKTAQTVQPNLEESGTAKTESHLPTPQHDQSRLQNLSPSLTALFALPLTWKI